MPTGGMWRAVCCRGSGTPDLNDRVAVGHDPLLSVPEATVRRSQDGGGAEVWRLCVDVTVWVDLSKMREDGAEMTAVVQIECP